MTIVEAVEVVEEEEGHGGNDVTATEVVGVVGDETDGDDGEGEGTTVACGEHRAGSSGGRCGERGGRDKPG